ncbi:hypothetical protein F5Y12DRAFT_770991 [Xylaria sp. FL1777]|nr:hypothetical protein F5Y12DRAFT_770991 [Xylaria sp. FL1777]
MALRGKLLLRLLDAVLDNFVYLKIVLDLDADQLEIEDRETCAKLMKELQRLVHFQVRFLLFSEDKEDDENNRVHRLRIATNIFSRFSRSDSLVGRWERLTPSALVFLSSLNHRIILKLVKNSPQILSAMDRVRDLLALAEDCARESAASALPRPNMRVFRRKLKILAAKAEEKKNDGADEANDKKGEMLDHLKQGRNKEVGDNLLDLD